MNLSIAIPESALSDDSLKADKTRKAGLLSRACAIFGVDCIFVYSDHAREDRELLTTVLRYQETPQFLRKRLFPKVNELKFAGVLQPLAIPSHPVSSDPNAIRPGDVREGVSVSVKGTMYADVGVGRLTRLIGKVPQGRRVTVRFKRTMPDLLGEVIGREQAPGYWGYAVRERQSLHQLLSGWKGRAIIASRRGRRAAPGDLQMDGRDLLVVFGSPQKDVHEILGGLPKGLQNTKTLNFFPGQRTRSVRLEEAVLGVLSIMDMYGER